MITYKYAVEIHPAEGRSAFRAMLTDPRLLTDFLQPTVGKTVGVEFDEASGKARFDKSDPQLSFKAFQARQDAAVQAALHAPAQSPRAAQQGETDLAAAVRALIDSAGSGGTVRLDPSAQGYDELRASIEAATRLDRP